MFRTNNSCVFVCVNVWYLVLVPSSPSPCVPVVPSPFCQTSGRWMIWCLFSSVVYGASPDCWLRCSELHQPLMLQPDFKHTNTHNIHITVTCTKISVITTHTPYYSAPFFLGTSKFSPQFPFFFVVPGSQIFVPSVPLGLLITHLLVPTSLTSELSF